MFGRILVLIIVLIFGVSGCGSLPSNSVNMPTSNSKFEVAADKQNDTVAGLTPEVQESLIQAYISAASKVGATRGNFVKVVNSLPVQGGTEFVVRVKDGFFTFYMDSQTKKISFVSGSTSPDASHTPMSYSVSPIYKDSPIMVFVGYFNLADAKKVQLTWNDGTTKLYELTNGILMLSPYDRKIVPNKYEIKDESGTTLFSGES